MRDANALKLGMLAGQDPANAAFWTARNKGYFAAEKLNADVMIGGPNALPLLSLLSAGQIDIATANWFSVIDAIGKGSDIVVLGAGFPHNPNCLISLPDRPVRTARDLAGKKLLLQFVNYADIFHAIMAKAGVKGDFRVQPVGFNADALFAGDGDAYYAFIMNAPVVLEAAGRRVGTDFLVTPLSDMGYTVPDGLLVTTRATLEQRRDMLTAFFRAMLRGYAETARDPDAAVKRLVTTDLPDAGVNCANQIQTLRAYLPLSRLPGKGPWWISPAAIDAMYDFARLTGRAAPPPRERVFALALLEQTAAQVPVT